MLETFSPLLSRRQCFSSGALLIASLCTVPAHAHSSLQTSINNYIQAERRAGRVSSNERTAWSVYDFSSKQKLVSINESIAMQSASMVKPLIALCFFHLNRQQPTRYPYRASVRSDMERMLVNSSNSASNRIMKLCGGPAAVQQTLKRHYGGILSQTSIREYIPQNGAAYRNRSSAKDYSRFLYALWHEHLPQSQELKRIMCINNPDRIRDNTQHVPADARIYDKTGSTAMLCGNMGIIVCRGQNKQIYPYTFIAIIEKQKRAKAYERWIRQRGDIIRHVSDMTYLTMKKRHALR